MSRSDAHLVPERTRRGAFSTLWPRALPLDTRSRSASQDTQWAPIVGSGAMMVCSTRHRVFADGLSCILRPARGSMSLMESSPIAGRFVLEALAGKGGMGEVYRAMRATVSPALPGCVSCPSRETSLVPVHGRDAPTSAASLASLSRRGLDRHRRRPRDEQDDQDVIPHAIEQPHIVTTDPSTPCMMHGRDGYRSVERIRKHRSGGEGADSRTDGAVFRAGNNAT
jgi:hypothetical protein